MFRHQKPSSVSKACVDSNKIMVTPSSYAPTMGIYAYFCNLKGRHEPREMFDKAKDTGLHFAASGNSSVGFDSLNFRSERRFTFHSAPFFVPCFHQFCLRASQLVRLVRGASARWVCFCYQSINSYQLRLISFGSEIGGFKTGASI